MFSGFDFVGKFKRKEDHRYVAFFKKLNRTRSVGSSRAEYYCAKTKIRKNSKKIGRHFDLEFEVKIVDFDDIQRRMGCPCIRFQFKLTI